MHEKTACTNKNKKGRGKLIRKMQSYTTREAVEAIVLDRAANCSLGVQMYCKKAALCHLPRVLMIESSTPLRAAVVVAPILKL